MNDGQKKAAIIFKVKSLVDISNDSPLKCSLVESNYL
jgi:hypothetical protein